MDKIFANPLFQQKMASVLEQKKSRPAVSYVDTGEIGMPQLSPSQLRAQAKLLNSNINQSVASAQLEAMGG